MRRLERLSDADIAEGLVKHRFVLDLKSRMSLRDPDDFASVVRHQCERLPHYVPEKFGWFEPLKHDFDVDDLQLLIPTDRGGPADNVWWTKRRGDNADGAWMTRWQSAVDYLGDTHATISISVSGDATA